MTQNTLHKQTARFISAVSANLPELDADVMQGWIQNPKALQKALTEALCPPETFTAVVDYSLSLAAMIKLGKYTWINSNVTPERFPLTGEGKWEVEYEIIHLNLDRCARSEDAVTEIKRRGMEPAKIEDLLTFGAKHPELQRNFSLVALGSVADFDGNRRVLLLYGDVDERGMDLRGWDGVYHVGYRFLAVKSRKRIA